LRRRHPQKLPAGDLSHLTAFDLPCVPHQLPRLPTRLRRCPHKELNEVPAPVGPCGCDLGMTRREKPCALARESPFEQRAFALIDDRGPPQGELDPMTRPKRVRCRNEPVAKPDPRKQETLVKLRLGHRGLELVHSALCLALELGRWCGASVDCRHGHAHRERAFTKAVGHVLRAGDLRRQAGDNEGT
jgi:hypothetical protein